MTDWALTYIRHVLAKTGWTSSHLAAKAGLSPSTINRPLREGEAWGYSLSRRTLSKIQAATGIDPAPFIPPGAAEDSAIFGAPERALSRAERALIDLPAPRNRGDFHVAIDGDVVRVSAAVDLAGLRHLQRALKSMEVLLQEAEAERDGTD